MDKDSREYKDAENYLKGVADHLKLYYGDFLDTVINFVDNPDSLDRFIQWGIESARDRWPSYNNDPEFWRNFKIVTGLDKPGKEIYPFCCCC